MYDAKLLSSYCTIKKWILKILIQLFYNNFQDKMINILYLHTCKNNWVRQAVKKKHRCDDGAGRGFGTPDPPLLYIFGLSKEPFSRDLQI